MAMVKFHTTNLLPHSVSDNQAKEHKALFKNAGKQLEEVIQIHALVLIY
jgi:hypothetical protein